MHKDRRSGDKKEVLPLMTNGTEVKIALEQCQHYPLNACNEVLLKECTKYTHKLSERMLLIQNMRA